MAFELHETGLSQPLLIDAGAFIQIVTNLIQNAVIHAFDENSVDRRIRVDLEQGTDALVLSLSDNGLGMSDEVRKRVFEPFFTTRRSQGGSGLGTHIVRNLITERFGGTIAVTTEVGVGTVWTFNLPIGTAALSLNQEDNP